MISHIPLAPQFGPPDLRLYGCGDYDCLHTGVSVDGLATHCGKCLQPLPVRADGLVHAATYVRQPGAA